jgi:hypothetical protein
MSHLPKPQDHGFLPIVIGFKQLKYYTGITNVMEYQLFSLVFLFKTADDFSCFLAQSSLIKTIQVPLVCFRPPNALCSKFRNQE